MKNTSTVYFVECKWGEADLHALARLKAKSEAFPWKKGTRREYYVIYARRVRGLSKAPNVIIYTLDDVEEDFERDKPPVEKL